MRANIRSVLAACASAVLLGSAAPGAIAQPRGEPVQNRGNNEVSEADRRASTRLELAGAYFSEGRFENALSEVKLALNANPDLPQSLNLQGLILAALGDEAQATDSFKRALQLAPQDADTLHNYGWFLCQRGRYPEADALFQRAIATPQYRNSNRSLLAQGVCEARSGALEKAEITLKRAYEVDAGNPATAMNLADVLYRRGEYERARFYVRRVNNNTELRNAESLWFAARLERRLGNDQGVRDLGNQLRSSYPASRETAAFERGAFDE